MSQVVVYNAGGLEILHRVDLKHAIGMLRRKVARIVKPVEGERFGPYEKPAAVELLRYIFPKWTYARRRPRKHPQRWDILERDRHTCAYCGKFGNTVDHVLPRGQGGETTWENCVTACVSCNHKKGCRTPTQAKMPLLHARPHQPALA